ncbi:PIN domain-containing protein [Glycomyces algeriensis]|uniref:Ribonuclease VapC n=1 Tax=Glycomyces algeriensis TaxID=256037 RepID=A0A9W6G7L1_9ACTN|nr:PIN domain-containing protein [Glycomyces algeriensis]MDA1366057.1 PIN domain-containing protein [Glycomyces algeriensis]MDR7349176.1 putative nucleic acid-binding protein [Glycomyces algeriensis]GLI41876.1 ribonuclease VapC [Glycomyces algeriensis]
MSPARYLIDTSALAKLLRGNGDKHGWDRAAEAGLIALCDTVELEYLWGARSWDDRNSIMAVFNGMFGWVSTDDRMFRRAHEVQRELTRRGEHRSAGAADLLIAAAAELHDLTLIHRDHDFECVAAVTGQPLEWFGPKTE